MKRPRPGIGHALRQCLLAGLTANALRPLNTRRTAVAAFAAGGLTAELAPQFLIASLADTAIAWRRHRASALGTVAAAASIAGLAAIIERARGAGALVETNLRDGIGPDYHDLLTDEDTLSTPWRVLARPFHMTDPAVEVVRDVNYTAGGRRARLDIYRAAGAGARGTASPARGAPVLVQVHGGAWMLGSKEEQGRLLMNRMAAHGWICVALNYRLAPRHRWPAQIVDVKRALAWVRANIASYGGDPDYLVLTGGSAGGHLASLAALTPGATEFQPGFEADDTSVAGCVSFYGVYDMAGDDGDPYTVSVRDGFLGRVLFGVDAADHLDLFREASPLDRITADAPDFFVVHGANDTVVSVRQARAFVARLRERSPRSVTYAELPGTQHAFEIFGSIRSHQVIRAVHRWLEWHHARWLRERQTAS